jgi:light-regulated signal transduction histidine kinase (bacteriophytochrome)
MPQTVKWAGDPHKPVDIMTDGTQQLTPRKSFEIWSELVEGISEPWSKNEITAALKLMSELVQILNDRANQIRKLNEQLKQAYDELDTFSFTISHDLKTPLASIKNYSELLLEDHLSPEEYKPTVEKIIRGADRMTLLIKEVLSYSRIGRMAINFQELDMGAILDDIKQELLTIYKDNEVEIDIQHTFPIAGDQTMIYQVFTNIIGNAVKYSSKTKNGKVVVNSTANADEVIYSVSDNGIGIDMKNGDQIFELFHRMQNAKTFEGTGVGLAIVKRIITRHQGRIWYESEPGRGTIFYLSFKTK